MPAGPGEPSVPFVGLAEALVLAAIRRRGVPLQRIRPALEELERGLGIEHPLASRRLHTDGVELLYDFGTSRAGTVDGRSALDLVVVRSGQRVFVGVVGDHLRRIEYGPDGYAARLRVPTYEPAEVVVDPNRSFGAPIFEGGGARVADVVARARAGGSTAELSEEFGVPIDQLEAVLRVALRRPGAPSAATNGP